MTLKHKKVATLPDQPGVEVNKAEWNDDHDLKESGGTSLTFGAIADGQYLVRSGTTLAGTTGTSVSTPTFPGGIALTGVKYPSITGSNLATGDNDLYTVPNGKRVAILGAYGFDTSVGNITWFLQVKISGTYYRLMISSLLSTGTGSGVVNTGYIAEAGEIISVNSVTNNGLNLWVYMVEFDNTCKVYSSKITSLTGGNDTVYTVPASTTAVLLSHNCDLAIATTQRLFYANQSGGARTITYYIVKSGQAVGTGYQVSATGVSVNDNSKSNLAAAFAALGAGDFVAIASSAATATQWAWVNVMEI